MCFLNLAIQRKISTFEDDNLNLLLLPYSFQLPWKSVESQSLQFNDTNLSKIGGWNIMKDIASLVHSFNILSNQFADI